MNETGLYTKTEKVKKNLFKKQGYTGGRTLGDKELEIQKRIREEVFKNNEDEIKNLREIVTLLVGSAAIFYDYIFKYNLGLPEDEDEKESFLRKLAFLKTASEEYNKLTFTTDLKAQEQGVDLVKNLLEKQAKLTPIIENLKKDDNDNNS